MRCEAYRARMPPGEPTGPAAAADDGELARRIGSRSPQAAEAEAELCRRYSGRIRLYGLRHLRSEAAASDLVQHVLLLLIERLRDGRVREPERLGAFVLSTCRMAAVDARRAERRREGILERFGPSLAGTERTFEPGLDGRRLEDCLAALAERERAVVVLTFYAERDSREIGREIGASPDNVRAIRHRALARLRACMGLEEAAA